MARGVLLFVALTLLFIHNTPAQVVHQDRELFIYNAAFGGLTAGIGAVINKPKGSNWRKIFVNGFWRGSFGGLVNYSGKKTLYLINKNEQPLWAWPGNILHYAGVSIIENAALNEPFLQNWHYEFGPARFDFSTNCKKPFKVRFLPEIIYATIAGNRIGDFSLKYTLQTGHLIFQDKDHITISAGNIKDVTGIGFGRSIAIGAEWYNTVNATLAHEIGHQFQYTEYQVFNTWLKPLEKNVTSKFLNTLFSKYVYADIPYFTLPYSLQGTSNRYKNFFEFEVQRFATNAYVPR